MTKDYAAPDPDDDSANRQRKGKRKPRPPREYKPREPKPMDAAQLQELAVGYAARYATTAAKLRRYLQRKLGERVWTPAEPADIAALVDRITTLGYVDDRAYATSKLRDLTARGFGLGRVKGALAAAGVAREDVSAVLAPEDGDEPDNPLASAIELARRRRFGPFAREGTPADPARRNRELAAMARAGHGFDVARRVLGARDEAAAVALLDD